MEIMCLFKQRWLEFFSLFSAQNCMSDVIFTNVYWKFEKSKILYLIMKRSEPSDCQSFTTVLNLRLIVVLVKSKYYKMYQCYLCFIFWKANYQLRNSRTRYFYNIWHQYGRIVLLAMQIAIIVQLIYCILNLLSKEWVLKCFVNWCTHKMVFFQYYYLLYSKFGLKYKCKYGKNDNVFQICSEIKAVFLHWTL